MIFGMDMTPLIKNAALDTAEFARGIIKRFETNAMEKLESVLK